MLKACKWFRDISPINEESLLVRFTEDISDDIHLEVKSLNTYVKTLPGVLSVVPSYNSLMVYFDLEITDHKLLTDFILNHEDKVSLEHKKLIVNIPVCYEMGLDNKRVADHTGYSLEEIIKKHSERDYLVYMIGFTPGFPYLGGMDEALETPRLETPRLKIEAGAVGIGGKQTGIYPLSTPGGWNIIGMTPIKLYDEKASETLLKMGQYVRFVPITKDRFDEISLEVSKGLYEVEVVSC